MSLRRRDFIAGVGCGTLAASLTLPQGKAEPKLPSDWIISLFDRGEPTEYRNQDLNFIGMPVGGLTTGQLYLGGDGQLWLWDIFNQTPPAEQPGAVHYSNPLTAAYFRPVDQEFTLYIHEAEGRRAWPLARGGFADIVFRGQYPVGFVEYRDPGCPASVHLEAFSPFIPLNVDDSSLPATLMRFTLTNTAATAITGELSGLLENAVARSANARFCVRRINRIENEGGYSYLDCGAEVSSTEALPDQGSMGLVLFDSMPNDRTTATVPNRAEHRPAGTLARLFTLAPGASQSITFAIVWHFPHLTIEWSTGRPPFETLSLKGDTRRHYATRFDSAASVARYLAQNLERLNTQTKLWHDTWYNASTLPHWLLERSFLNASTLATSTAYRFADGRFYGSEGVGGGGGTCTHVWHYEQAMGRLFPELDTALREHADLNPRISFKPDGMIESRGELVDGLPAVDGQAGTILRALRNHQTSPDHSFLKRNWPHIKKAMQWLIAQDADADGILEGAQPNTLDGTWYGPVAWLSGLYLAALRAAEEMAHDAGDSEFADSCRRIFEQGQRNIVERLFNGEYFINRPDSKHLEAVNSGTGCEIDQVLGQSWAHQVSLGRVLPQKEIRAALTALWRHNFKLDVGPYRTQHPLGRWYAMPGEGGLLMCTFPRPEGDSARAGSTYFNECMTGFEHQVAGHMLWEGMVEEGLAIERAIHDRYHASKRNPWNEVEAGDHYARAMASYGVYIAACGFEYHGPRGYIAFAPRLSPENFKGAFTAAEGWGTFSQTLRGGAQVASLELNWGRLRLKTLCLSALMSGPPGTVAVTANGKPADTSFKFADGRVRIELHRELRLEECDRLEVTLTQWKKT